jgi:hypothetical protein
MGEDKKRSRREEKEKRGEVELGKIIKTKKDNCFPFTSTPALFRKPSFHTKGLLRGSQKGLHRKAFCLLCFVLCFSSKPFGSSTAYF